MLEECQTVTELFLIHQYYSVYVKQCQTMLEECQTVTELFDISIFILYMLNNVKQC